MKMTSENEYGSYACELIAAKELRFHADFPCDVELDTVRYAVCRFLRKSKSLCKEYVKESYRLRLASGKGRKTKRRWCLAPAALLELPGAWVHIGVSISATGVTVEQVGLHETYEAAQMAMPGSRDRVYPAPVAEANSEIETA